MVRFFEVESRSKIGSGEEKLLTSIPDEKATIIPSVGDKVFVDDSAYEVVEMLLSYYTGMEEVYIEVYVKEFDVIEGWDYD